MLMISNYVSTSGQLSDTVNILTWCLEAVRVWIGNNKLQLNPSKTEWLWILRPIASRTMPSLVLEEYQTEPVSNLGLL